MKENLLKLLKLYRNQLKVIETAKLEKSLEYVRQQTFDWGNKLGKLLISRVKEKKGSQ